LLLASLIGAGTRALVVSAPPARPDIDRPTHDEVAGKSVSGLQEDKKERGDRYGDPLPADAIARLGTLRFRQGTTVYITHFSPDGKNLLLGGLTLALWETATGRKIRDFPVSPIRAAMSPDGKTVAVRRTDKGTG
jgi:hypothetical protein